MRAARIRSPPNEAETSGSTPSASPGTVRLEGAIGQESYASGSDPGSCLSRVSKALRAAMFGGPIQGIRGGPATAWDIRDRWLRSALEFHAHQLPCRQVPKLQPVGWHSPGPTRSSQMPSRSPLSDNGHNTRCDQASARPRGAEYGDPPLTASPEWAPASDLTTLPQWCQPVSF